MGPVLPHEAERFIDCVVEWNVEILLFHRAVRLLMMKKSCVGIALSCLLAAGAQASSSLEFAVSPDTIWANYSIRDESGGRWSLEAAHNDDLNASMAAIAFNVVGDPVGGGEVETALGLKGLVHDTFQTALSLALGGSMRVEPENLGGIGFEGGFYYAPSMLNTNDADRYWEGVARVTYSVHEQAQLFLGVHNTRVHYDHETVNNLDILETVNVGFRLIF